MAPATSSPLTTLRRATNIHKRAPASTGICQRCWNRRPRGIADPAIAPMTAGPAPSKKCLDRAIRSDLVEVRRTGEHEDEGRGKGDQRRHETAADSPGGVAHDGHGLDDRSGGDLAECDGIEELGTGHPVVRRDGVVLHERDDDESAAIGEGTDLERHPDQRSETAERRHHGARLLG